MLGKTLGLTPQNCGRIVGAERTAQSEAESKANQSALAATEQNALIIAPSLLYKHPTITAAALFVLILSGPPRFHIRDPEASLRGDTDWVVILNIVVWGLAGLWILWQFCRRFQAKRPVLRLRLPQILGLAMILGLAASTWASDAPKGRNEYAFSEGSHPNAR